MSTEIIGLSHLEREIIANAVRYNIRDFDYDTIQLETQIGEDGSGNLNRSAITILIAKLTAILRLANSMDKTHKSEAGRLPDGDPGGRAGHYHRIHGRSGSGAGVL